MQIDTKMKLDHAREWLDVIEANFLDADYCVATDDQTHFKLAAIHRLRTRNKVLETALSKLDNLRDEIGKIIGPVL